MRRKPQPTCALCRSPAPRACKVSALLVDAECASRVRQSVGFSAYTAQRRKLWAAAAEAPEELKTMPIYCTALKRKQLRAGRRLGLRFLEARYWEIVKRAMAPGGTRRFAAVTHAGSDGGEEIAIGTRGCLCEILESSEGEDGTWNVIVETGAQCRVLSVNTEEMHRGPALIIGNLEELEEDEEEPDDDSAEEGNDSEALVLGEEGQLELLRERVQLLELLNAAMELEQARLEQRRLELTMLLSQRRLYQELIEMQSEVADLVGLTTNIDPSSTASRTRAAPHRRNPEGMGSASSSSEQWRSSGVVSSLQLLDQAPSGTEDADLQSLLSPSRHSALTSPAANVLGTGAYRSSRVASATAELEASQQRSRRTSRGGGVTTAEALRRRTATLPGVRTAPRSSASPSTTPSGSGSSVRGAQFRRSPAS